MRMSFNVELKGLEISKKRTIESSKKVLWKAMNKMQEIAVNKVPVDTGLLKNSIILTPKFEGASEYILADGVDYGIHVEYGTSPHFVPITPLKGWSRRVLGNENIAYAISHTIAKYGTPAQPFFRPALLEVKEYWIKEFWNQINT